MTRLREFSPLTSPDFAARRGRRARSAGVSLPTAAGRAGRRSSSPFPARKDDGLTFVAEAVAARRGARSSPSARRIRSPTRSPSSRSPTCARRSRSAAARLHPRQPATIVAVTGTSGKTSVAAFTRQIWSALGREAASLGTLGVVSRPITVYGALTTPDPVALHKIARRARRRRRHASRDRGLLARARPEAARRRPARRRRLHQSLARPSRLSRDDAGLSRGQAAPVRRAAARPARRPSSTPTAPSPTRVVAAARARGPARCSPPASKGAAIRLVDAAPRGFRDARSNSTTAASASTCAAAAARRFPGLQRAGRGGALHRHGRRPGRASSPRWRRSKARPAASSASASGAARRSSSITRTSPTRWKRLCATLRPFVRGRLIVVFGCGGDRDAGKRPIMGEIATRARRCRHRHRRQSALGEPRRDPRRDPRRRARARSRSATAREAIRAGVGDARDRATPC